MAREAALDRAGAAYGWSADLSKDDVARELPGAEPLPALSPGAMQVGSQTARMVLWIPVPKVGMNEGMMASGPSHHNLRIDGLEFTARIVDLHLPVDTALRAIDVGGPRRDFAVQGPEVADAAPA